MTIPSRPWLTWTSLLIVAACGNDGAPTSSPDAGPEDASVSRPDADASPIADARGDAGSRDADVGPSGADAGDSGDAGAESDGIPVPGLTGPVTVRFDAQGVLHVECSTPEDCMAAQGYFHAAHRFGQMDLSRRAVQGRLTELYWAIGAGQQTFDQDVEARTVFADRGGRPLWERLRERASERTLGYLDAYARGVNAWIRDLNAGENDARLTRDWALFSNRIEPWTVDDSISTVLLLAESLTNNVDNDLAYSQLAATLSAEELVDLFPLTPATSEVIDPDAVATRARGAHPAVEAERRALLEQVRSYQSWLRQRSHAVGAALAKLGPVDPHDRAIGSNNWVIRGSGTAEGTTLLANDPHLPLTNPALWYLVNLDASSGERDFHIAGVSFPGFPGILLGQNQHVSWGATTTVLDQTDAYREEVVFEGGQPVGVRFQGETVPFVVDPETFADPLTGDDMTMDLLYVPHHGPVIDLDPTQGTAVTLRWSAQEVGTDVEVFPDLWEARTVDEARTALEGATSLGQNFVVIDGDDNIGWFPYSSVPSRPWASPATPPWGILDGASGDFEWGDPIPLAQLPQARNPAQGWILTANNDMTGNLQDGDPTNDGAPYLQAAVATGYRALRAANQVREDLGRHDVSSMQAIQADVYSQMGADTVPAILALLTGAESGLNARAETVRDALSGWAFECPSGLEGVDPQASAPVDDANVRAESLGCLAYHVVWSRLLHAVFGDELARAGYPRDSARDEALARYLRAPESFAGGPYWDDVSTLDAVETSSVVIAEVLNASGEALARYLGGDTSRWQWGRLHTVTLRAADGRPITDGPFANDGGWYTVDVANPSFAKFRSSRGGDGFTSSFAHTAGASMRLVCVTSADRPGQAPACTIDLPGRQRFFDDVPTEQQLMRQHWLPNDPFPLRFERASVLDATVETMTLIDAD